MISRLSRRGILAQPPVLSGSPTYLINDDFNRSVAAGSWGSAPVGGVWTLAGGSLTGMSVGGTKALAALAAGGTRTALLADLTVNDVVLHGLFGDYQVQAGATSTIGFILRQVTSSANRYYARLSITSLNVATIAIVANSTQIGSFTIPDYTFAAGDQIHIKVELSGVSPTSIKAKVWKDGTAEPGAWQVALSDSTAGLQSPGNVGVFLANGTGMTNGTHTYSVDDVSAISI